MATLLLNLRDVPDDEAEEIRAVLDSHAIDCYETPPSRWRISAGGIWLRDDTQAEVARELLAGYQRDRAHRARELHATERREGRGETAWQRLRQRPLPTLIAITGIVLMLLLGVVLLPAVLMR